MNQPLQHGTDLQDAIAQLATSERLNWFNAAQNNALPEGSNLQFQHLVRYSLARHGSIRPTTLTAAQRQATALNYTQLLGNPTTGRIAQVRADLLAGAPHVGTPSDPPNLETLVEQGISDALDFRNDSAAWSAVFVVFCVRTAAIQEGLEAEFGGQHVGRNSLLLAGIAHHDYLVEAYNRNGTKPTGTYHAFPATARAVQKGDIIVQDRQPDRIAGVVRYEQIPTPTIAEGRQLHGDIVVDGIAGDHVVTIGGNLGNGVRERRYPIDAANRLVVAEAQDFAQESSTGILPNVPPPGAAGGTLSPTSTGRIFALLSLVEAGWLTQVLDLILS